MASPESVLPLRMAGIDSAYLCIRSIVEALDRAVPTKISHHVNVDERTGAALGPRGVEAVTGSNIETVTVMFVDVVGSTALRARVGEEHAERLRLATDAIVNGAVGEHAGEVVKNLGDGAMARFHGAAGAVDAAVSILQQLEEFNRQSRSEAIQFRIGISAGDVTVDDGDYFGLPVVEAQRLESTAAPNTIRCADLVKQLGRGRGNHDCTDLGELVLKGLSEPVRSHEVRWARMGSVKGADSGGLPPVLALAGGMPFSGRAEALRELLDLVKKCDDDEFATAFIAGEPGIGKTRLVHEVAVRVASEGWQVLAGRCDEDVAAPFQAMCMALDWAVDHLDGGDVELLGSYPGELARLLPDIAARIGSVPPPLDADPEAERYRLMQAVESWLASSAERRPVLLVLDDLHWADKGTLILLQNLIRSAPARVFVVCTYRDTDVDRSHPLSSVLADLRRLPGVQRIPLSGLPTDEVREFLERAGGHPLDEAGQEFAELVERETAGNPFFVSELLRHLIESGLVVREDGRWTGDLAAGAPEVPEGIREVVGRRLGRLGHAVEDVLRAASVIGYEFDVDLLAAVMGTSIDEVIDALDIATPANIVVEIAVDRFRFSHALVRETLHAELSSTKRARQHRKVAIAMEQLHDGDLDPVMAELAMHWREATIGGDLTRAIELSIQVGLNAMALLDPGTAAAWFGTAAEMMEEDSDFDVTRRRVMVDLADAQIQAGDLDHRITAREAASMAIEAGDADTAVAALTLKWRTSYTEFNEADERKIEMLRESLESLDLDDLQRADLTGELASELIFTRDIEGRALALDDFETQLSSFPVDVRGRLRTFDRTSNRFDSIDLLVEAVEARSEPPGPRDLMSSLAIEFSRGDGDALDAIYQRWLTIISDADPLLRAEAVVWEVPLLVLRGHLDAASLTAEGLLEQMRELRVAERATYRATTSLGIERELGTHTRLLRYWVEPAETSHPSSASNSVLAWLRLETGDHRGAAAMLAAFHPDDVADDAGYIMAIAFMSEVAAVIGDESQCRALLEHCRPGASRQMLTGGIFMGSVNRLVGRLGDRLGHHDDAALRLQLAAEEATGMQSPTWVARSQLDLAASRLAQGDIAVALTSLDIAEDALDGLDLPASRARCSELRSRLAPDR